MHTLLFLAIRALHVGMAALWLGSTVFTSVMLTPAVETSGPSGGQVMMSINRRGMHTYFAALAGTTLLTGIYLFWHFTGFSPSVIADHAGMAFGTGGVAGLLAGIIGGVVVGRGAHQVATIMGQAGPLPDGPAKGALMAQVAGLQRRMKSGTRAVIGLQTIALVLMAVGHYV